MYFPRPLIKDTSFDIFVRVDKRPGMGYLSLVDQKYVNFKTLLDCLDGVEALKAGIQKNLTLHGRWDSNLICFAI